MHRSPPGSLLQLLIKPSTMIINNSSASIWGDSRHSLPSLPRQQTEGRTRLKNCCRARQQQRSAAFLHPGGAIWARQRPLLLGPERILLLPRSSAPRPFAPYQPCTYESIYGIGRARVRESTVSAVHVLENLRYRPCMWHNEAEREIKRGVRQKRRRRGAEWKKVSGSLQRACVCVRMCVHRG